MLIFTAKVVFADYFAATLNNSSAATYTKSSVLDSVSIIVTAYAFVINFYPIYSSLDKRTNENGLLSVSMAMIFCCCVYITFSLMAISVYGSATNPDLFQNIKLETNWTSYAIRGIFLVTFLVNISFMFYPGKEALLTMIDEITNKSLSKVLVKRIENLTNGLFMNIQDGVSE
jgi:amino acid permease